MKVLSSETTALLDKLYNLRSEDSYILVEMEKEKEVAEETKERTAKQKQELQEEITALKDEETRLAEEGANLREVLSGINIDDFKMVLNRLNINFNPEEIKEKIDATLPATIEEVVNSTKKAEDELVQVEEEMNNAITKIDELAVRKDAEIANQEKLNEYFTLALSGNINITREAITSLISQFGFSEEEQREVAKLMMFPEDALYDYDKKYQDDNTSGKSISDVLIEAKESVSKPIGEIFQENNVEEDSFDNKIANEDASENINEALIQEDKNIFPFVDEETYQPEEKVISDLDFNIEPEMPTFEYKEDVFEPVKEEKAEVQNEETMMDLFKRLGLSEIMFVESELSELVSLNNKELVEKNVNILNKYNINIDIVSDNVNILSDPELDEKISLILSKGKTADDIYFNPSVIKKYDLNGLKKAIDLLEQNGLDPKKVPLMAY